MILEPLPTTVDAQFLVGGCVRKPVNVLRAHLASLAAQVLPPRVKLVPAYIDDNEDPASSELLAQWCADHGGLYTDMRGQHPGGFSDQNNQTHIWTGAAMERMGELKNSLIRECVQGQYAGAWLVDADLVMHPRTFWSLYHCDRPITCAVFWTKWQNTPDCPAHPQVWLRHPYGLDGRGMNLPEFLRRLVNRELVQVWGQGACTLYRRDVFEKGVSYSRLPDLPTEGMWQGEDRHLCVRAERLHVPMYADAWPDIYHAYHPHEQRDCDITFTEKADPPAVGDEVSVQLQAMEPIQDQGGNWVHLPKQHIRGRLGRLPLMDDVEAAILRLGRGDSTIVSVQYPVWAETPFAGQRRLIEVTLIDYRPYALPRGVAP